MPRVTDATPRELLALAEATAREAGALLLRARAAGASGVETKSSATDMVSDADRASERLIVERLRAARPDDAILGEEGGASAGSSGVRWVIDPLDGTTNYLYGLTHFAVSIAAEVQGDEEAGGEVVAGVVYDPVQDEAFTASLGGGAHVNGRPIAVSGKADLATALVATGFGYDAEVRARQGPVVARVLPLVRDIRRHGAAALDLCNVACGRVDAYYERGLQAWDMAAGALIVREAGGLTSAIEGGPAVPGSMVAATPALLEPLRVLVAEEGGEGT